MRDDGHVIPANGKYTKASTRSLPILDESDLSLSKSANHGLVRLINGQPQGKGDTILLGFRATQDRGWPS